MFKLLVFCIILISRKRAGNATQNCSILLNIALNLLKNEKTEKQGIAGKRLKVRWNEAYLLKVLNIKMWVYPELLG